MTFDLGMIGLGVMGENLLLNMADHGFHVVGYDRDPTKISSLPKNPSIKGAGNIQEFIGLLKIPRVIMLLVPAGKAVDSVLVDITPYLKKGDVVIDGGNSYYKDTEVRARNLAEKGIYFLGVGISGGEYGARNGPSIMPGGDKTAYAVVQPILEACAAKVGNEPCVAYLGSGSSGHFVKMVHNGIEYAIMQLISESYDLLKRGLDLSNQELLDVYSKWKDAKLNSYLIEITAEIFNKKDQGSGKDLIDLIKGVAEQNGTGMWTAQSGMELHSPIPTIDYAVAMRDLSTLEDQRKKAFLLYPKIEKFKGDKKAFIEKLEKGLYASFIIAYAQGFAVIKAGSDKYNFGLDLKSVAKIWRGGCIIRSQILNDIMAAFQADPKLSNLCLDPKLSNEISENENALREIIKTGIDLRIPIPTLMTSLSYIDGYRSEWLPTNLIQAQRDCFGSHKYERNDEKGTFHTEWENTKIL